MSGSTFTLKLVEEAELYAIYDVTSNVEVNNVTVKPSSNAAYSWVTAWNKTSGRLKIEKNSATACNITVLLEGDNQVDDSAVYYCEHKRSSEYQNFVVIGPGLVADKFKLGLNCNTCSIPGCEPAKKSDEYVEKEIHNCCDEGETKVRQAALDELFCNYNDEGLSINYYKPKCNSEEYITEKPNDYCEVYCGVTAMYKIPATIAAATLQPIHRLFIFG